MRITRALLEKFSGDECSSEEILSIQNWLEDGSWPVFSEEEEIPDDVRQEVWNKLQEKKHLLSIRSGRRKQLRKNILKLAAVVLVLIGTAAFIYYQHTGQREKILYATNTGEHQKIVLADSSIVFLSPHSTLKVVQPYGTDKRELDLKGEAVFEVAQNASSPFTVVTGEITTTALGTSFKVTSFPDKDEINIALSYGKIVVKDDAESGKSNSIFLDPGEEVVYNKSTHAMHKTAVAPEQFDYKHNILYFKNAGLKEVVEKLERYYHINIQYSSLKNVHWSVSGEFNYQPLEVVMKAIAYSCNIKYEINGNKLIFIK